MTVMFLLAMAGCGGSGVNSTHSGTSAVLKLSTVGTATTLSGIQLTVTLPADVTVNAVNGVPAIGVVTAIGGIVSDSTISARYIPATTTGGSAQLVIVLASSTNFTTGEFAAIRCDVGPSAIATFGSSSFTSANFSNAKVVDGNGATISDVSFAVSLI